MQEKAKAPQVSIIVPVYNVEGYLRRCLNSILAQTLADWECICVDDGSPDGSGAILDEYAAKDARFVVIHKENGGTSTARNAGLDAARAEYIGFVDPDDWIEANTYEAALEAARRTDADIVQWECVAEGADKALPAKKKKEGFFDAIKNYKKWLLLSVWAKLFKKDFLNNSQIRFPAGVKRGQDALFSVVAYALADKCFYLPLSLYHYDTTRETSVSHNITPDMHLTYIEAFNRAAGFIEDAMCRGTEEQKNRRTEEQKNRRTEEQKNRRTEEQKNRRTEVAKFLLTRKCGLKAHYLINTEQPDFRAFRSLFPEANRCMLSYFLKTRTKLSFVMLLASWHLDAPARALIWLQKRFRA